MYNGLGKIAPAPDQIHNPYTSNNTNGNRKPLWGLSTTQVVVGVGILAAAVYFTVK